MKNEKIIEQCRKLLKLWTQIEDNLSPRNHRYCDHQLIARDWWLGSIEATRIICDPRPPYRLQADPDRQKFYVDLWYAHRLQILGNLPAERYRKLSLSSLRAEELVIASYH